MWQTPWAPTPQELQRCVECGLCLPHCPTFRLTGSEASSPRGRIGVMRAANAGLVDPSDPVLSEVLGFCLQCRACEAACASLMPYGRVIEGARAEMAAARPTPATWLRRLLLGRWVGHRRLLQAASVGAALLQRLGGGRWLPRRFRPVVAGLRRLPLRPPTSAGCDLPAIGEQVGVAGLLTGCVMDPWFGPVHEATITLLRRAGFRVIAPKDQTCCGAMAAHEGAAAEARKLAARNVAAFAGVDIVVSDAAGCSAHLKEYGHWVDDGGREFAGKARDVTEVVAEAITAGRLPRLPANGRAVAVQDPCHLRHAQRIIDPPRLILEAAGFRVVEIDPDGLCCGAGGAWSLFWPAESAELGDRKAAQIQSTGLQLVASANPGCEIQLRAHLPHGTRVAHPVELYAEALAAAEPRSEA